jgi:transposase-like protein
MNSHAPLTPKGREAMVRSVTEGGLSEAAAAQQFNTTPKTVAKWVGRFRAKGADGLRDRSSRPHSLPSQTPVATRTAIETLRRQRHTSTHRGRRIGGDVADTRTEVLTSEFKDVLPIGTGEATEFSKYTTWIYHVERCSYRI